MSSYRVKLRRGTTAETSVFTGEVGEVTVDTTKKTLVVHDGATRGGHPLPRDTDVKTDLNQLTDNYGLLQSYVDGFTGSTEVYAITVAPDSSGNNNVFYITGLENPHIVLTPGNRYVFDVSDSSNTGHPLYFTADDGVTNYTTNVSRIGTEGTAGAKVIFIIPADVPALKYYCSVHGLSMGNQISSVLNTPSSGGGSSSLASFDISPALPTGETSWNLATDGDLSITEAGNWTFTATTDGTVDLSMKGAGGGYGKDTNALGGTGGLTSGKISVSAGDVFKVTVGSKGVQSGGAGAYGGGGAGGNLTLPGSGGGYSGIFEGNEQQSKSILIAGGGGGGHGWDAGSATGNGGSGGGADGLAGTAGSSGGGATQTSGGAGAGNGTSGTPLTGGTGGNRSTNQGSGGGGGGGYFGGGGGAAGTYNGNQNGTPGGGGSGYIGGTSNFAVTDGVTTAGSGSTTEVDGTFSMVGQVATTEETPTVATPTIISNSYGTVLHVTTDGAAGVNADFTDSSTTAATVTAGGSSVQLSTFSPYRHGGYSMYNTGTNHIEKTGLTAPGTGDFTIEAWVYVTDSSANQLIWDTRPIATDNTTGINVQFRSNNVLYAGSHNVGYITGTTTFNDNEWVHVALVRSGGTLTLYGNGVSQGSTAHSVNLTSTDINIGSNRSGASVFNGYIKDLRVVNAAVYTADFTPPTEALTAITDTALLTCNTPYIKETISGTVTTEPTGPYDRVGYSEDLHGGSVYFDGTDGTNASEGYLSLANSTNFGFGTDDFTIEAWVYFIERPPTSNGYRFIFSTMDLSDTIGVNFGTDTSGEITFTINQSGASDFTANSTGVRPEANQWMHLALVKNSGTVKIYQNGQQIGSDKSSTADTGSSRAAVIGAVYTNRNLYGPKAYISDLRVVKGNAVYTEAFTPPAAPLVSAGANLHIKGVEGHIIDKAQSGNNFTLVGNTVASIAESKYAGSSMYFDGAGDSLELSKDVDLDVFNFGTADWTVEFWVYPTQVTGAKTIFSFLRAGPNEAAPYLYSDGTTIKYYVSGTDQINSGVGIFQLNTWRHIAVVRNGNDHKLFVDGIQMGSTWTNSVSYTQCRPVLGDYYTSLGTLHNSSLFHGYIEDFRITKGIARYTEDFTPPTESLDLYTETGGTTEETTGPTVTTYNLLNDSSKTGLLITTDGEAGVNSSFTDSSSNAATVTAGGNSVQLNTFSPYRHGGYSTNFDGSSEMRMPADLSSIGTGDFTMECWIKTGVKTNYQGIMGCFTGNSPDTDIGPWLHTNNAGVILGSDYDGAFALGSTDVCDNNWHHIALVRASGTITIYVDGIVDGTMVHNQDLSTLTSDIVIGDLNGYNRPFTGSIADARITTSALYTEAFTPPTERLTVVDGTELLTCNLPYFADSSSNSATITTTGNVSSEVDSPYDHIGYIEGTHGGSVYFDQTGISHSTVSRMQVGSASPDYDLSSGGTVEAWVYLNSYAGGSLPDENRPIWCFYNTSYNGVTKYYSLNIDNNGYLAAKKDYNGFGLATSTTKIPLNTWTHVVFTTTGASGTNKFYVNGKDVTSTFTSFAGTGISEITLNGYFPGSTGNNDYELWVGAIKYAYNGKDYIAGMDGYISDFRVFKGDMAYSEDFTPPLSPLSSTDSAAHIKGVEGHIIDKSQSGNNFTLVGDITASTTESKYATSSIALDGNSDHIQLENTPDIDVSTGDFTWEGWFNWNDISNNPKIFTSGASATSYWQLYVYNSKLTLRVNSSQTVYGVDAANISTNQWYHIALVRSGDTFTVYRDGAAVITDTYSGSIGHHGDNGIGGMNSYPAASMNGYMEDVRLSKFARYIDDFTVPNASLEAPQIVQPEGSQTVATAVATGGATTDITVDNIDYRLHTFTTSSTFSVTTGGAMDVLIVGGGGGGGFGHGGGGGGGAVIHGENIQVAAGTYNIVVGNGGDGNASNAQDNPGGSSSVFSITATGGGSGANEMNDDTSNRNNGEGGAGANGGGGAYGGKAGGIGTAPAAGTGWTVYAGHNGGSGAPNVDYYYQEGGGGGASGPGTSPSANTAGIPGGDGADGIQINIDGNNYYWGAGGGGTAYGDSGTRAGNGGLGGGGASSGGGGSPSGTGGTGGLNNGGTPAADAVGGAGGQNTGSGGGGGANENFAGGNGGSGIVIFRYPYQGTVTETAPTSTSYRYMKVVLNSVGSGTQAQVTEVSFTGENGATDFITGQTITNWYGTGSTATSQSPTIALVNNAQSPANSEHTNLETLPFTLEYDLGTSYVHGTELRYLQLGSSDSAYRYPTSVTVYGATQPDFSDEVALITNSAQAYASVNSNTLIDLVTSIPATTTPGDWNFDEAAGTDINSYSTWSAFSLPQLSGSPSWTFNGSALVVDLGGEYDVGISTPMNVTSGTTYTITINLSQNSVSRSGIMIGTSAGDQTYANALGGEITSSGEHVRTWTATTTGTVYFLYRSVAANVTSGTMTIDNITISPWE